MAQVVCGVTSLSGLGFQVAATAGYAFNEGAINRAPTSPAVIDITSLSGRLDACVARNLLGTCRAGARRSQAGAINRAPMKYPG